MEPEGGIQIAGGAEIIRHFAAYVPHHGCQRSQRNSRGNHGNIVIAWSGSSPFRGEQNAAGVKRRVTLHVQRFADVVTLTARVQPWHGVAIDVITAEAAQVSVADDMQV